MRRRRQHPSFEFKMTAAVVNTKMDVNSRPTTGRTVNSSCMTTACVQSGSVVEHCRKQHQIRTLPSFTAINEPQISKISTPREGCVHCPLPILDASPPWLEGQTDFASAPLILLPPVAAVADLQSAGLPAAAAPFKGNRRGLMGFRPNKPNERSF